MNTFTSQFLLAPALIPPKQQQRHVALVSVRFYSTSKLFTLNVLIVFINTVQVKHYVGSKKIYKKFKLTVQKMYSFLTRKRQKFQDNSIQQIISLLGSQKTKKSGLQ